MKLTTKIGQEFILITHETITDKDERTIIQTPLYFWSMPQIVKEYLSMITWYKKMKLFLFLLIEFL